MKCLLVTLMLLTLAGCEPQQTVRLPSKKERPTINLPLTLRQENWRGPRFQGSCVWASTISLLRWQGQYQAADWVRKNCGDGARPEGTAQKLDQAGIRYAYVTNGDVNFLEWCCRTRRGAGVTVMGGAHCVTLVYLDDKYAAILDNNKVSGYIWVPREAFLAEWRASYGWGFTVIYTPAAPLP